MRTLSSFLVCLCIGCIVLADTDETQIICKGKVVDTKGKPVVGADVRAYGINSAFLKNFAVLGKFTTGTDGEFSMKLDNKGGNSSYGFVVAKKDGLCLSWDYWYRERLQNGNVMETTLELGKPAVLAGTIVTKDGLPIAGATVCLLLKNVQNSKQIWLIGTPSLDWITVTTGADGKFEFNDIPETASAAFIITAPKMAKTIITGPNEDVNMEPQFPAGTKDIKITLAPEAKITGKVINEADGKPVAGVRLYICMQNMYHALYSDMCESKSDGSFMADGLYAGQYQVTLMPDTATLSQWVCKPIPATLTAGETTGDVCVQLSKGGLVEVTVTDETTKKPLADAYVYVNGTTGKTDEKGIATLRLIPGNYNFLQISKNGYINRQIQEPVEVAKDQTAKFAYSISPCPKISGIVVDQSGKPVAETQVKLLTGSGNPIKTAADGKFEITANYYSYDNNAQPQVCILARHEGRNMAALSDDDDEKTQNIKIELQPAGAFECFVNDTDGKPIANAKVLIMMMRGNMGFTIYNNHTDVAGYLKIDAIPSTDGSYRITAEADGFGKMEQMAGIIPGQTKPTKLDFTLQPATKSISGIVLDEKEKPVAGASIRVYGDNQPYRNSTTDKDGKFHINNVIEGGFNVHAYFQDGDRYITGNANAKGGDKDIKIILGQNTNPSRSDEREKMPSLVGKPLGDLQPFNLKPAAGKKMLICFCDINQRSSRHAIKTLAQKTDELTAKGIVVLAVQASAMTKETLDEWRKQNKIPFQFGCVESGKLQTKRILDKWGVQHLPWLIFTDRSHTVQEEDLRLESIEK